MKEIPLVKTFIDNLILLSQPDQQITVMIFSLSIIFSRLANFFVIDSQDRLSELNENLFKTKSTIEQKKVLKQFYNDILMTSMFENLKFSR